ncbi:hypothetical protein [Aquabacterium sp.]|uniref:hypothetical protein n=1 Tax=Aquabacterium sp. TaxID=1872578 RepID=UPI003D063672
MDFALDIDGLPVLNGKSKSNPNLVGFSKAKSAISHIARASEIANFLTASVAFELGHEVSEDDYTHVAQVAKIIKGNLSYKSSDFQSNPSAVITAGEACENIKYLFASQGSSSRTSFQFSNGYVPLFGRDVPLPTLEIILDDVQPKMDVVIDQVKPGDEVQVEWIPGPNFRCTYQFLSNVVAR